MSKPLNSYVTYAEFTEKYILKPLKMQNSGWFLNAQKLNKYAKPYYDLVASLPFYECITYPDGGLRTNTADLSKYLIALINGYNGNQSLLSNRSYQMMFTPQFSKDNPPKGILPTRNAPGADDTGQEGNFSMKKTPKLNFFDINLKLVGTIT